MKIIKLEKLNLGNPEITSASSLININNRVFACCDDQYNLYELKSDLTWKRYFWQDSPSLPIDLVQRKKLKPDFEALLSTSPDSEIIILVPSGSKSNRTNALSFNLLNDRFSAYELTPFFRNIFIKLEDVNIEGACVHGTNYLFLNRGVQSKLTSIIRVDSNIEDIKSISPIDFGNINGVILHGSELVIFEDHLFVLAVAEATDNTFDDGKIIGSSLFKLSLETFAILDSWQFELPIKTEGLCRWRSKWLVCTDPDGVGASEFFCFSI